MALTSFSPPSTNQILQPMLNDYKALSNYFGYNLTVDPGSEIYIRFSSISGQLGVLYNMMNVLVNSKLIDTASGADLDRVANDFGLQRRGATSSQGFVQLIAGVAQTLQLGSTLTGPNSLQFQVNQTSTYQPGSNVPIVSVDLGSQTNLPVGTIMTWSITQPNMQSTCLVSVAITGGADAEDDNSLRNRLYLTLQAPPQAGNAQQLSTIAGSSDGIIQQAFIYSNFNGAGTQLIALTGYQTFSYIGRDIPHLPTDGYTTIYGVGPQLQPGLLGQPSGPYNLYSLGVDNLGVTGTVAVGNPGPNLSTDTGIIYGQLPGTIANVFASVVSTVNNTPADVAAVLTLPYPVGAANNGFGNGWLDFQPWPNPDGYYVPDGYCKVVSVQGVGTSIGSQTGFGITVRAPSSGLVHTNPPFTSVAAYNASVPTNGATHIQWVNRSDFNDTGWLVVTATILAASDNSNDTWSLVLDTPLLFPTVNGYDFYNNTGVVAGDFIFPASTNAQNYLNNVMQQFALLGPGQTTASQGLLQLGASRYPSPNTQFPSTLGVALERALVSSNQEVYNASVNSAAYYSPTGAQANTGFAGNGKPNVAQAYNSAFNAPAVNAPPNIFVPHSLGFYPIEFYNFGS